MEEAPHEELTWDGIHTQTVERVYDAIQRDVRRLILVSPTGSGKSRVGLRLTDRYASTVYYTNRKMLVEQMQRVLTQAGKTHGVRAAGHPDQRELGLQISSIPTENARTLKKDMGGWDLHRAALVLIDEAHLQTGAVAQEIMRRHYDAGAVIVGLTATPLDLGGLYDEMIVSGTLAQYRAVGALVLAEHYGPDEPDLKAFGQKLEAKMEAGVDLSEAENRKAIMTPTIFARVIDHYERLNPAHQPTLLFAPGVKESVWFAEQFHKVGITAAHIDGQEVWINGTTFPTSQQARDDILGASQDGRIKVLCNRFVLREGIDAPWLTHGILATVFGSLQSYLQSLGRLLRAALGKTHCTIQDHGGNWHRHGSVNIDRLWELDDTNRIVAGLRRERLRAKQEREPFRCPQCTRILTNTQCSCGFEVKPSARSRPVVQSDGTLKPMLGDIYKPRRVSKLPNAADIWKRMYHRARSEKWNATFLQAEAMFAQENHWGWPSRELPLMPKEPRDFFNKVADVPMERLR